MLLARHSTTGRPEPAEAEVFKRINAAASASLAETAASTDCGEPGAKKGGRVRPTWSHEGTVEKLLGLTDPDAPSVSVSVSFSCIL